MSDKYESSSPQIRYMRKKFEENRHNTHHPITHAKMVCHRCGRKGHHRQLCMAKYHINGTAIYC